MAQPQKDKKTFTLHDLESIQPETKNQEQAFYFYNSGFPVMTLTGSPGTGKTFCSLYLACRDILDKNTDYRHLKIIRSAVPTRDVGFLPGSYEEKIEVYEQPYREMMDTLFKYQSKNYERLKETGNISFDTTSHLRGLTWDNTIVVVDEFASMSYHELDTVMTRVGVDSRIIFCGDVKQSDLQTRNKEKSGFYDFMNVLTRMKNHANIEFTTDDIVRGDIVAEYLIAREET